MVCIAVVDDDVDFVGLIAEASAIKGWETLRCYDSEGALELISERAPDVILLDIRIEELESGWQLLELLQMDPRVSYIPIIVCSADRQQLRARAEWLRRADISILEKPFDLDDLYRLVTAALDPAQSAVTRAAQA